MMLRVNLARLAAAVALCSCASRVAAQMALDANCSFTEFAARANAMDKACCPKAASSCQKALPHTCTLGCATSFTPFFKDCRKTIDVMFDVHSADTTVDHKATQFAAFDQNCANISSAVLEGRLTALKKQGCHVDVSGVVARHVAATHPANCKDNDAGMRAVIGQSCAQGKAKSLCALPTVPRGVQTCLLPTTFQFCCYSSAGPLFRGLEPALAAVFRVSRA